MIHYFGRNINIYQCVGETPHVGHCEFCSHTFLALSGVMFCQETDANGNLFCDIVHINVYMTVYS
jgi:hypothetical protein